MNARNIEESQAAQKHTNYPRGPSKVFAILVIAEFLLDRFDFHSLHEAQFKVDCLFVFRNSCLLMLMSIRRPYQ